MLGLEGGLGEPVGDEDIRSSCEGSSSSAFRFRLLGGVEEKLTIMISLLLTSLSRDAYLSSSVLSDSCQVDGEQKVACREQRSYFQLEIERKRLLGQCK